MPPIHQAQRFVRQALKLFGAQMAAALLLLAGNVAMARALGPAEQGRLTAVTAAFWLATLSVGLGTPTALSAQVAASTSPRAATLYQALRLSLVLSLPGVAVLYLSYGAAGLPVALAMPFTLYAQLLGAALLGRGALRAVYLLQFLPAAASAAAAAGCLLTHKPTLAWRALSVGQLAAATVATLAWLRHLRHTETDERADGAADTAACPCAPQASWWRSDVALLSRGIPIVASQFITNLGQRGDILALASVAPPSTVACYGIAKQVAERLALVASSTSPLTFAATARQPGSRAPGLTPFACRLSGSISLAAGVVMAIAAPWALPWVFGHAYRDAVGLLLAMIFGSVLNNVSVVLGQDLLARGLAHRVLACCVLGLMAQGIALAMLLPRFGALGAAGAVTLAAIVEVDLKIRVFRRQIGLSHGLFCALKKRTT